MTNEQFEELCLIIEDRFDKFSSSLENRLHALDSKLKALETKLISLENIQKTLRKELKEVAENVSLLV